MYSVGNENEHVLDVYAVTLDLKRKSRNASNSETMVYLLLQGQRTWQCEVHVSLTGMIRRSGIRLILMRGKAVIALHDFNCTTSTRLQPAILTEYRVGKRPTDGTMRAFKLT